MSSRFYTTFSQRIMKTHPTVNSALKLIPYLTLPMRKVVLSMCQLGVTYVLICNMGTSKVSEYPFLGSIIPLYLKNSEPYNKQLHSEFVLIE